MANPSLKRLFGPIALTATPTTNVYQGTTGTSVTAGTNAAAGAGSALIFDIIKQLHFLNKTGAPASFNLWLGATGANVAGTELFTAKSVNADDVYDWFCNMKLLSTDFLVGDASALTTLTITGFGEQYVV